MKPALTAIAAIALASSPAGATLKSAQVTKVVNDVRIYQPSTASKKASVGDVIRGRTSLQTGRRSRSELRFQDRTITRLGANSIFSFDQGTRDLRLEQGTLLLQVPKNAGGATIRTATVTAAITGTTVMMEFFPKEWVKIIVLEGTLMTWIKRNGGSLRKTLRAGEMMVMKANDPRMPGVVKVDVQRIMKTAGLVSPQFFDPLPGSARNQINQVIGKQVSLKKEGSLTPVNPTPGGPVGRPGTPSAIRVTENREVVKSNVPPPAPAPVVVPIPDPPAPPPPREGDDPAR